MYYKLPIVKYFFIRNKYIFFYTHIKTSKQIFLVIKLQSLILLYSKQLFISNLINLQNAHNITTNTIAIFIIYAMLYQK